MLAAVCCAVGVEIAQPLLMHDDEQRGLPHAREVDRLVEVALRRGAVADERAHHAGVAAQREAPGEPGGVRQLGAQRDLHREAAHAVGDAAAVGMPAPVDDELLHELVTERADAGDVAVVGHEPVGGEVERAHHADDRCLLAGERRHRGEPALPLQVPEPLGRPPGEEEVAHEHRGELRIDAPLAPCPRRSWALQPTE